MNETISLTTRQQVILKLFNQQPKLSRKKITQLLPQVHAVSKATLARDLAGLVEHNLLVMKGSGPSVSYTLPTQHPLLNYVDLKQYFALEPDQRTPTQTKFKPKIFNSLTDVITKPEKQRLQTQYRAFTEASANLKSATVRRELERYIIELSWKSSKIEGNTYSLLETESLIKQGKTATGKTAYEATMILNHKNAFETILEHRADFKTLKKSSVFQLHQVLTNNLDVETGLRQQAVGITGTTYQPLAETWQLKEYFQQTTDALNSLVSPLEKSLWAAILIAYLQPFADGNKRTARMLSNAILLAHDYFPLSYRSLDEEEYKQALILFYETNNLYHCKRLFLEQYTFALETYFL